MEQTIQNLNQIVNKLINVFPDENDLKGFQGISKTLIIDQLNKSAITLEALRLFDNRFETIILKRELADLFNKIDNDTNEKFEKIKDSEFNSILKQITKINFLVTETYFSVQNTAPIRTEAEILHATEELRLLNENIAGLKKISEDINALKISTEANIKKQDEEVTALKASTIQSIDTVHESVKVSKTSLESIVSELTSKQINFTENEKKIVDFLIKIESDKTAIETTQKNTTQWQADILAAKTSIEANEKEYSSLNLKSKKLQTEIETTHDKIFGKVDADGKQVKGYFQETEDLKKEIDEFLKEQQTKYSAQFDEIKGLLPGATAVGLAQAYQIQKASYTKPIRNWSWVFVWTLIVMTIVASLLLYSQFIIKGGLITINDAIISFLKDLPFFIPTIWLAANASKQVSQNKRLQQEYAFKETNARSFHGHKMQIEQLMKDGAADKELLASLVAQLVFITAENPSKTLDNVSHEDNSPMIKFLGKIFPSLSFGKWKNSSEPKP